MKKLFFLPLLLILGACSNQEMEQDFEGEITAFDYEVEIQGCINIERNFGALGVLEVTNDKDFIYVSVVASSPKKISQVRLALFTADAMANLTGTAINNMVKYDLNPTLDKKTFLFPLYSTVNGSMVKNYPDDKVNILARATIDGTAVWAEGSQFDTGGGQGYYFNYEIQTCQLEDTTTCDSAYMEGDIELNTVYTTPKNWGWAQLFNSAEGVSQTFPMYAGAGQNNHNGEGTYVGDVTITWSQATGLVEAAVSLTSAYTLGSYEVFVADQLPDKRPGPGKYTNSGDADGLFYVIVHANVCW
ncbi:MAG: hypothetical protein R3214_14525 [Christiangramia sp.]|nr:hypothetical protein [Christiangramia sp.]